MSRDKPNKENGYLMNLYRNPESGWLFGVCAGLGDHFEKPYWMMRLAAVTLFLFTGELAILLYIAGIFLLAKNPEKTRRRHWRASCGYSSRRSCSGQQEWRDRTRRSSDHAAQGTGGGSDHAAQGTGGGRSAAQDNADTHTTYSYSSRTDHARGEKLFSYSPSPSKRLQEARRRLKALEMRLRSMEAYVTSSKYRFNKEINEL